ncbi:MAG: hypothetical protein PWP21_557 [Thermosediminibacterales bacterium]|nr:hypothetical protein [Thermosediminibacterales bacterium]
MKKTGAQLLVDALVKESVDVVFGIPGIQNMDIYDALEDVDSIISVVARHEQGAGYMADGYARASGKPGVVITVPGPGALNAITPLGEAYSDSSPVLLITVEVASTEISHKRGYLHEMKDQMATFKSVVKKTYRVTSAKEIPTIIQKAYKQTIDGRPRPVYVEIPIDFLKEEIMFEENEEDKPAKLDQTETTAHKYADIEKVVDLLKNAKRPLIYAGLGAIHSEAGDVITRLAEKISAPVITTTKGKGVIPADHFLAVGNSWCPVVGSSDIIKNADLILCIGTGLSARTWLHNKLPLNGKIIHIDIDPESIGKNFPVEVGIVGNALEATHLILTELGEWSRKDETVTHKVKTLKNQIQQKLEQEQPELNTIFKVLEKSLKNGDVLVSDLTLAGMWAARYLPVYKPRTFLFPMEFGTLGFALPAAIGAKLAEPQKNVICLSGDGSFLFNSQELSTAVKLGIDLLILLFNDGRYGSVRVNQIRTFGRSSGTDLCNPDFIKLADAYGVHGVRVEQISDFKDIYGDLINKKGVRLIEIPSEFLDSY